MERTCDYNEAVICDRKKCYHCGWDPAIAKAREESVRRSLLGDEKLYKVPFTGYCEVWAGSPEEAAEKADNDEMFFVHYEFGDPVSTEKEDEDELD